MELLFTTHVYFMNHEYCFPCVHVCLHMNCLNCKTVSQVLANGFLNQSLCKEPSNLHQTENGLFYHDFRFSLDFSIGTDPSLCSLFLPETFH